jgi:DNA-binding NtrC family response regulator
MVSAKARRPNRVVHSGRPPVLCVEQRDIAEIGRLVQALQAPLLQCATGREAIEYVRGDRTFVCVIAPLLMPDMGAQTLIESLQPIAPGLAVIVVVDSPVISEAVHVMRGGAHAVVESQVLSTSLVVHLAPLIRAH